MQTITLGDFQQHCSTILQKISQTHQSIFISQQGKLLAQVIPISPDASADWLGCMDGTGTITGDILAPTHDQLVAWEVLA